MAIAPLTGTATATAKVGDVNALITALNAELATLASRIKALEDAVPNMATKADLTPFRDFDLAHEERVNDRLTAIEQTPMADHGHASLDERVLALENLVVRSPAQDASPIVLPDAMPRPANISADEITLVYDKATLYLGDIALHALRIDENKWRLVATLNYVVISPAVWTYDEIIEGTPDEVYAHAYRRLTELAELKPQHDRVHDRVREMSEGET